MATDLAIDGSDLDLQVCGVKVCSREEQIKLMDILYKEVSKLAYVENCNPIFTARVPIIKLVY